MTGKALANRYGQLTGEERFRLIRAAVGRGDDTEAERLANAAQRIPYRISDHAPFALAFNELSLLTFVELLDATASYEAAFGHAEFLIAQDKPAERRKGDGGAADSDTNPPAWARQLEVAYAAGFILRTKADGWKLFCQRLNVPHYQPLWPILAGFERLERGLARTEHFAFQPDRMVQWFNDTKPAEAPEATLANILNVEKCADESEVVFRLAVERWRG